jgi:hypothetical protein
MAVVRLSDVVIPEVYLGYQALNTPELTAFWQAGLVVRTELMDTIARTGGSQVTLPFWKDLDSSIEPNMSNDDPADMAVPNKVGTGKMTARKAFMNQGFSSMDLIGELSGSEPLQHIRNRFGTYWARQYQRRLIASLKGILADNIANDAGDMVVNISAAAGELARFNSTAAIDAAATMGDALDASGFGAIAVHSAIRTKMVKDQDIIYIPDAQGQLTIATYKGMRVIVDDALTYSGAAGPDRVYMSVLIGTGFFGFGSEIGSCFAAGEGVPMTAVEVEREARAGNGGGMETIWERKTTILHPYGWSWTDPTGADALTEFSPVLTDLAKAAPWNRVVDRKQAPIAFVLSKA